VVKKVRDKEPLVPMVVTENYLGVERLIILASKGPI